MSVRELDKVMPPESSPRRRNGLAIALAVALAIALALGSFEIGRATGNGSPAATHPGLDPVQVVRLVGGISRPQDGLLYGEWIRDHILKRCPAYAPADIILVPRPDGSGWIVNSQFRGGTRIKGACPGSVEIENVAFVAASGRVERIPVDWNGPHVIGANHEEILPNVPQGAALLDHFRSGETP